MNMQDGTYPYPPANIDPKLKNKEWGIAYAKAAWFDWSYIIPRTVFYNAADKYEEARLYALGKQPINKYKKILSVDEQTNDTFLVVDWSVRPVIPKYRDIFLSRMIQQEYSIVATPIDPTAKTELDQIYAEQKAKIAVRQLLQQQNPELASHPLVAAQAGEPFDFEEMEMRIDFGEQFNRSKDAEQAIQLALYQNKHKEFRKQLFCDWFDCGVAGYKEWLGDDNMPKFRKVNPECVVTNYCRFADFRDLVHAGEVIDVGVNDLAAMRDAEGNSVFTDDQIQDIVQNVAGNWSNPSFVGRNTAYFRGYDKFKAKVLDIEWYSYNELNYENNVNRRGNIQFNEVGWDKRNNKKDKYIRKRIKVIYKIKWIVGTDYCYDFQLMNDMKRSGDPKKKGETTLSYKFYSPNFYEMKALSMMDRLIPLGDEHQLTVYRIQNFINRMVPNGWWVDLDSLENVALNKGGTNMKPRDLLQMYFETGILAGRSKDVMGDNINYKPVIPISNNNYDELQALFLHKQQIEQAMQQMLGLNELTDGSTPNPKTLATVAEFAVQSTNNALYPIQLAERHLLELLASDIMIRTQQGIRKGGLSGYAPALNTNTLKFIEVSPELALHDYGIMLEEKPSDDQKQVLLNQMQNDIAAGLLDTSDAIYVMNVYNIKQAQQILAYKVKKNKEAAQMQQMALNQQTIQGQQQSAQMTEEGKRQTLQLEAQFEMQKIEAKGMWDYRIQELKNQATLLTAQENNQTKIATTVIDAEAKKQQPQPTPA